MVGESKTVGDQLRAHLLSLREFLQGRILFLEVRPRKYGFAVFEGPISLLDSGVGHFSGHTPIKLLNRIDTLIEHYAPVLIVVRHRRRRLFSGSAIVRARLQIIGAKANRYSVNVRFISAKLIQRFFRRYGYVTKHDIASLLATWFPEIGWQLPAKRRPWQSERYFTVAFDSIATAIAFYATTGMAVD